MIKERSAGFVLFREVENSRLYLLLQCQDGTYEFPKGIIEKGESEKETATRELVEETGLYNVDIRNHFREVIKYIYSNGADTVHKKVIYFLAQTTESNVTISNEHVGHMWVSYNEAMNVLPYDNLKSVLNLAESLSEKYKKADQSRTHDSSMR